MIIRIKIRDKDKDKDECGRSFGKLRSFNNSCQVAALSIVKLSTLFNISFPLIIHYENGGYDDDDEYIKCY